MHVRCKAGSFGGRGFSLHLESEPLGGAVSARLLITCLPAGRQGVEAAGKDEREDEREDDALDQFQYWLLPAVQHRGCGPGLVAADVSAPWAARVHTPRTNTPANASDAAHHLDPGSQSVTGIDVGVLCGRERVCICVCVCISTIREQVVATL